MGCQSFARQCGDTNGAPHQATTETAIKASAFSVVCCAENKSCMREAFGAGSRGGAHHAGAKSGTKWIGRTVAGKPTGPKLDQDPDNRHTLGPPLGRFLLVCKGYASHEIL